MTYVPGSFMSFVDEMDTLLHYVPYLRKAVTAMAEDDPQKHEDEHVKEVKRRTESQSDHGR